MKKIIAAILGFVMLATPALACFPGDPDCWELNSLNDGSIDTYFSGSGWNVWFNDALSVDEYYDDDIVVEDIWTQKGSVMVIQNINIEDHKYDTTEVILNKYAEVDPCCDFSANIEKGVIWDDEGEIYRTATLYASPNIVSTVSVGADVGTFVDDIKYYGKVTLFESVGLNTGTVCEMPKIPDLPDMPECAWCIPLE
jgi:hypothetical protein